MSGVGAGEPFGSEQPGITTRHLFSAGAHYDPQRLSFGAVVGVDEHTVAPGAGFDWHAHRGVHIVSWVLAGALRHEDSDGTVRTIGPGPALVQSTGDGVRHTETNASDAAALRFVQITIVGDAGRDVGTRTLPTTVAGVGIALRDGRLVLTVPGQARGLVVPFT